ncbi:tripartite tricarboxylate transporter TctB family protein [Azohydromonas caseinilytica]|uniref:Tripartite tricarboxylate transporter TctB family protein n=1 Tax=Azohydromonas caseinilytica TaxID=2728836 RepID=A0A848F6J7_9BURK|nr:tripartite tricarboxylate transporter TctB family protein [Azohydromonas caseinilytica]NML14326.1 tripartite tricarboxylate transporter TctB family protein [Azohydromonas caseinilytica]
MSARSAQSLVGLATLAGGALLAWGASAIPSEAGYAGVGPNFLPWLVSVALLACGAFLLWEAASGGFRQLEEPAAEESAFWSGFVWVSAGLLANAALIERLGFVLSCALCFMLAVRGFKSAEGRRDRSPASFVKDLLVGLAIAAPVYWMFTKGLAINLPGLTTTGWL